jgi:hypothetical protein
MRLMPYYAETNGSHSQSRDFSLMSDDFLNKNLEVTVATFVTQVSIQKTHMLQVKCICFKWSN